MRLQFLYLFIPIFACATIVCYSQNLPIKPKRIISFTTNEGTNMNVDISPDGKTLLFDLLGDIYSLPSSGGAATQLTHGLAINFRPAWSPDGHSFAYISDFTGSLHLHIRNLAGTTNRVLGKSEEQLSYYAPPYPLWMPDRNYIAVAGHIYGLAGAKMYILQANIQDPIRFSTTGQWVYYHDSGKIYRYEQANDIKKAISPKLKPFLSGTLSPDAHWWVYVTDSNSKKRLVLQNLEDNTERTLVSSLLIRYPSSQSFKDSHYVFSADSKNLFIGYGGKIHRINVENGDDQIVPFIAKVKIDVDELNYHTFHVQQDSFKIRYTRSANASPDGKHLVFCALDKLYIMDLPNGKPHQLVAQSIGQFQPIYSPDGKWIAYVSWCDTIGGYLWRVPASGGQPEQLTSVPGQYQRPVWSPDGMKVAIVKGAPKLGDRDDPGNGELEIVPVNGGKIGVIEKSVPLWNQLEFSLDGSRIIYERLTVYKDDSLQPILVSRNLDGGAIQEMAEVRTNTLPGFIQQVTPSPDNRFIVYSLGEELYLTPVCKLTEPAVIYDIKQNISLIRFAQGVDPHWEKRGKMLSWSYANQFFRIDPDKVIAAAQETERKNEALGLEIGGFITAKITPDQTVTINISKSVSHTYNVIALKDTRIITMQGQHVIEHGTIVIKGGRIIEVGPASRIHIPAGARLIDLAGTTVMPGFVDMHLHMRVPPNIYPQQSWMQMLNLALGITTARDPSSSLDSFAYKELIETREMLGPRLYTVGRAVRFNLEGINRIANLEDALEIVNKRKIFGGTTIKQYMLPTRVQRQYLLEASKAERMNMTNEGDFNFIFDIAMLKDGSTGVEHNPDWGEVYNDVTSFIAKTGAFFCPTLQVRFGDDLARGYSNYLYWRHPDSKILRFADDDEIKRLLNAHPFDTAHSGALYPSIIDARIRKNGGRVILGSHGNDQGIGVHNELWALQMGGLTNFEALQAATIMGAEGLGIQKDIGSIEVGKIADLLVLNKNPLDDIHNSREIRYVMKDGVLYDADTLDEIWPVAKKCPEWRLKSQLQK